MIGLAIMLYVLRNLSANILQVIFIWSLATWTGISVGSYLFPPWAEFLGWLVALSSMLWVPGFAIYEYFKATGSFNEVR